MRRWGFIGENQAVCPPRQSLDPDRIIAPHDDPIRHRVYALGSVRVIDICETFHQSLYGFNPSCQQRHQSLGSAVTQETIRCGQHPGEASRGEIHHVSFYRGVRDDPGGPIYEPARRAFSAPRAV